MRCSVVVPTYNRAGLLSFTLLSLASQDLDSSEFEVLVVDDGSSDNTKEVVESFADRLNIRYFFTPDEGYCVARARNIGIHAALGETCVLVDSGILLASYCLRAHCEAHESSDKSLAVCGYVRGFNENNEDAEYIRQHIDPKQIDDTLAKLEAESRFPDLREEFYAKYGDDFYDLPAPWLVFWTCNVSAKTQVFRNAGLFDEQFTTWGGEDVELAYRMYRQGCRFVVVRSAASIHHPHEKSYERNMRDARSSYLYFAAKHKTPITALVVDNHFWTINDIIRKENLPRCEDFLRALNSQASTRITLPDPEKLAASGHKVFVFAPHPDDETIAAGGAICHHRESSDEVYIVFSTDGSESHSAVLGIHADPCPEELAAIRQGEAIAAAETLGVPADHVILLHFKDTQLATQTEDLTRDIKSLLMAHRDVGTIYLPDPDRELNADHRITGRTILAVVHDLQLAPRLLKYVVWDKDVEREFKFQNRLDSPTTINDYEPTEIIDITRFHSTKLDAMAKHRTQVEFFCKAQVRPVVPVWLMEKLARQTVEHFRVHPLT